MSDRARLRTVAIAAAVAMLWTLAFASAATCAAPAARPLTAAALASQEASPTPDATVTILAVGDLMCRWEQLSAALRHGTYDFRPEFAPISAEIASADFALGNLETTLRKAPPYHGFPVYRSPRTYADALKSAGFDALTTANNHALDGGATGVRYTGSYLTKLGIAHTGTDKLGPAILEHDGVRIAVLAYTYATNGIHSPFAGAVNRIGLGRMKTAIAKAHSQADLVFVCLHFGTQYSSVPEAKNRAMAKALIDAGADLILGSHPHVVRPIQVYKGHYIVYSMGNLVSSMIGKYKDLGIMVSLKVTRVGGVTKVASLKVIPVFRDHTAGAGRSTYRVVRISSELAHPDALINKADIARMKDYRAYCRTMFGSLY
jgi:poly-gamma-glutamate synthesis protein (capsule biosynthesis protein)